MEEQLTIGKESGRKKAIVVGINKYEVGSENIPDLAGAENDASSVYEVLVNSEYSIYEEESSYLLGSPEISVIKKGARRGSVR